MRSISLALSFPPVSYTHLGQQKDRSAAGLSLDEQARLDALLAQASQDKKDQ